MIDRNEFVQALEKRGFKLDPTRIDYWSRETAKGVISFQWDEQNRFKIGLDTHIPEYQIIGIFEEINNLIRYQVFEQFLQWLKKHFKL